jgi:FAD-linked sulfhydryl oxidase
MNEKINPRDPTYWGPPAWIFLHSITESYPRKPNLKKQRETKIFFKILGEMLPCYTCKINYRKHLKELPITDKVVSSRDDLANWLIGIHNKVNESKHQAKMDLKEMRDKYLQYSKTIFSSGINLIILIFIIIITLSLLSIYFTSKIS